MNSAIVFAGSDGLITRYIGYFTAIDTGVKSRTGSNGRGLRNKGLITCALLEVKSRV